MKIEAVVGHEPVSVRGRRNRRVSLRSYPRNFAVYDLPGRTLEEQTQKCREWCKERIALHQSGEFPIKYIHVTFPNGDVYQWTPARGWVKKESK